MPLIQPSTYQPPPLMSNGHFQSVFPTLARRINGVQYVRERIDTPDGDFLDLDWSRVGSRKVAIISHGLEGHSRRHYVLGMVRALNAHGWDACAWNFRGCSGEPNRTLKFYHSGATYDLETVVRHIQKPDAYTEIALMGFSLGGNLTLKYLGEKRSAIPNQISRAVTFSVPLDLSSSSRKIGHWTNRPYMIRFLRSLHQKIREKMVLFPHDLSDADYGEIKNFKDFDDRYTAPLHGFKNAEDYWHKCSAKPELGKISIPTLIVNAQDDPFLPEPCYPVEAAQTNPNLFLEMPFAGGHVGFMSFNDDGEYWSERRALAFLEIGG